MARTTAFRWSLFVLIAALGASCSKSGSPTAPGPDRTPPSVVSSAPGPNAIVPVPATVTATFSEALDPTTITTGSFVVQDGASAPIAGAVAYADLVAMFTPQSALRPGALYYVNLDTAISDLAGNRLPAVVSWSFSTDPPTTPPVLLSTHPAGGMTEVPQDLQKIVFRFDRRLDPFSGFTYDVENYPGAVYRGISGDSVLLAFEGLLALNTTYTVRLGPGLKDAWGNMLTTQTTCQFTTKQSPSYWAKDILDFPATAQSVVETQGTYYVAITYVSGAYSYAHIYKVDQAGTATYFGAVTLPSFNHDSQSLIATSDGGLLLLGNVRPSAFAHYPYIAKFDPTGANVWVKTLLSIGSLLNARSVVQCADNGFLLTLQAYDPAQPWVVKTNATGDISWQRDLLALTGATEVAGAIQTPDGGYLVTGSFGAHKAVIRMNATGALLSTGQIESDGEFLRMIATADGGALVCGNRRRPEGYYDYYLAKLNSTGSLVWERSYEVNHDGGRGLTFALCEAPNADCIMVASDGLLSDRLLRVNSAGERVWTQGAVLGFGYWTTLYDLTANETSIVGVGSSSFRSGSGGSFMIKMTPEGTL